MNTANNSTLYGFFSVYQYRTVEERIKGIALSAILISIPSFFTWVFWSDSGFPHTQTTVAMVIVWGCILLSLLAICFCSLFIFPSAFDRRRTWHLVGLQFDGERVQQRSAEMSVMDATDYHHDKPTNVKAMTFSGNQAINAPSGGPVPTVFIKIQQERDAPTVFYISEIGYSSEGKAQVKLPVLHKQLCVIRKGQAIRLHDTIADAGKKIIHQLGTLGEMLTETSWPKGHVTLLLVPRTADRWSLGMYGLIGAVIAEAQDAKRKEALQKQFQSGIFINEAYGQQLLSVAEKFGWAVHVA